MEIWKDIDGFPGYQVSDEGRVRSFWYVPRHGTGARRTIGDTPRILPQCDDGRGYAQVSLIKDRRPHTKRVHRLVAEAFVPNPDPEIYTTVDHIVPGYDNKRDNRASNLQWLSRGTNVIKAWDDGMCRTQYNMLRTGLIVTDLCDQRSIYFPSIKEASIRLNAKYYSIQYALKNGRTFFNVYGYEFFAEYSDDEEEFLFGGDNWEYEGGLCDYDGPHY